MGVSPVNAGEVASSEVVGESVSPRPSEKSSPLSTVPSPTRGEGRNETERRIVVVGCGPGSLDYVTEAARRAVAEAEVLVGSRRLLETFASHGGERIVVGSNVAAALDQIARRREEGRRIAVLVSGDPGVFSLSASVVRRFGRAACEVVPGISSVQVAFARLGLGWTDARILSAHGRLPDVVVNELRHHHKIAILAGARDAITWSGAMAGRLAESHAAFLCENLTLDDERVRALTPKELAAAEASPLSIVLLIERRWLT